MAAQIVVTGVSAGGIAAFAWTNFIQKFTKNPSVILTMPDSSIFLDVKS